MRKNELPQQEHDAKQASNWIAVLSIIGLTICFVVSVYAGAEIPIWLYAIFGGGILGTDNILRIIKSVFRIDEK